jgi:predicted membrane protein
MDPDRWQRKRAKLIRRFERGLDRSHTPGRHLFSGLVFVVVGVVFLLGNMGMLNVGYILRFWPVILIAAGMFKIIEYGDDYADSSGIFWVIVGSLILLGNLGILRVAFRDLWPVVLIGLGVLMLWRSALGRRRAAGDATNPAVEAGFREPDPTHADERPSTVTSSNSILSATAILGNVEQRNNSQDLRGGSATAVMGRCEIDFRAAAITKPHEPVLEVFAMWGGIEIRVPPDWTVVSHVDPIMGSYEDATQPPKEETKRFVIRGTVIMGGIEVTN